MQLQLNKFDSMRDTLAADFRRIYRRLIVIDAELCPPKNSRPRLKHNSTRPIPAKYRANDNKIRTRKMYKRGHGISFPRKSRKTEAGRSASDHNRVRACNRAGKREGQREGESGRDVRADTADMLIRNVDSLLLRNISLAAIGCLFLYLGYSRGSVSRECISSLLPRTLRPYNVRFRNASSAMSLPRARILPPTRRSVELSPS